MDHPYAAEDEPIAMCPMRGEEEEGYMWQMKRTMYGTRRASCLFQEPLNVRVCHLCHQVYQSNETDSMTAIDGDGTIAEGEPRN